MPTLTDGALVSETDLASLAAEAMGKLSRAAVARVLVVAPSAVTMALDPARYPTKGHALRRRILREFAGFDADGPLYRLRKTDGRTAGDAADGGT